MRNTGFISVLRRATPCANYTNMNRANRMHHRGFGTRSYDDALQKLYLLSSNRAVTSLFEPSGGTAKPPTKDLNAAAIPEMLDWLHRAGYSPHDLARMKHIHVAGTKGKGSVCAYATSMLRRYTSVGTYTSPHLVTPRERIAIDGEPVSQEEFTAAFFELWDRFTEAATTEGKAAEFAEGHTSKPFYFRFLTILAWHIFLKRGVESVVMECGIGGEYDATNVLPKEAVSAAVISQLGIDHVAMLGETLEEIAWHKAGILKEGVKGFTANGSPAVEVLRSRADEKGAKLAEVSEASVKAWGGVEGLLQGDFQKQNQALAVLAVKEHLGMNSNPETGLRDLEQPLVDGLRDARIRGRCEVVEKNGTTWLLDGAHTRESLDQVAKWFTKDLQSDVVLVFNQQERNAAQLLEHFVGSVRKFAGRDVFSHALFTRNDLKSSAEPDLSVQTSAAAAMKMLAPHGEVAIFDNVVEAVARAEQLGKKVLVTGSLHLVGGVLRVLEPDSLL